MNKISIKKPSKQELIDLGALAWPIWEKEVSTFDWFYSQPETCYVLEGRAEVKTADETVSFGPGDLVLFPQGTRCVWAITQKIKKHYKFG